jgi:hypothetical protein
MALQQLAQNQGKVGSVGAVWPPAPDANNQRIKGFCPAIITGKRELDREVFAPARSARLQNPDATRTTFRAFVKRGLAEGIRGGGAEFNVEAAVPVDTFMPGFDLVYFGRNDPVRTPPQALREKEKDSLASITQNVERVEPQAAMQRVAAEGYQITLPLNGEVHNERDIRTLLNLYQEAYQQYTFPINETTIKVMLGNGNRLVIARDSGRQIASALIAEECELPLSNGKTARLYELSDFATFLSHSKKGLMTALQVEAVRLIRSLQGGSQAIIYAEDRAPWEWVNKSSQQAGMEFAGTLPYHCTLMARRSVEYAGGYESLNVWYAQ